MNAQVGEPLDRTERSDCPLHHSMTRGHWASDIAKLHRYRTSIAAHLNVPGAGRRAVNGKVRVEFSEVVRGHRNVTELSLHVDRDAAVLIPIGGSLLLDAPDALLGTED